MPRLIEIRGDKAASVEDAFVFIADDQDIPAQGDIIVTLSRFQSEGDSLLAAGRRVGVRLQPSDEVEALAYDLPRLAVIDLVFAKFRDGRPYSAARLLRERYGYGGQVRASGDVLREQAQFMLRCGFDAFVPSDGSSPAQWLAATHRYRHVYQRGADNRAPIYAERAGGDVARAVKEELGHGF
jgi:uncharacterized protein (DUF934 family)